MTHFVEIVLVFSFCVAFKAFVCDFLDSNLGTYYYLVLSSV